MCVNYKDNQRKNRNRTYNVQTTGGKNSKYSKSIKTDGKKKREN